MNKAACSSFNYNEPKCLSITDSYKMFPKVQCSFPVVIIFNLNNP